MFLGPPLLDDNPTLGLLAAGSSNIVDGFILAKELAVGANNLELVNAFGPPDVGFGTT